MLVSSREPWRFQEPHYGFLGPDEWLVGKVRIHSQQEVATTLISLGYDYRQKARPLSDFLVRWTRVER